MKKFFAIVIVVVYTAVARAQPLEFEHLTINDGLSQSSVFCITKDKQGFLWFGTLDGLNRYDGYSFKIYKNNSSNSNSVAANNFYTLYPLRDGRLVASTQNLTISVLHPHSNKILRLNTLSDTDRAFRVGAARSFFEAENGTIWCSKNFGLASYSTDFSTRKDFHILEKMSGALFVDRIMSDDAGNFLCLTKNQPYLFNTTSLQFIPIRTNNIKLHDGIFTWVCKFNNIFLFGGSTGELFYYEQNVNEIKKLSLPENIRALCSTLNFRRATFDKNGNLWIGTETGLLKVGIDWGKKLPTVLSALLAKHDPNNPKSLSHNNILDVFIDDEEILWIGTSVGLNKLSLRAPKFSSVQYSATNSGSITNGNVWMLLHDAQNNFIVGTQDGYSVRKKEQSVFQRYTNFRPVCGTVDSNNNMWFGLRNGIIRFVTTSTMEKIIDSNVFNNEARNFYSRIITDANGILWGASSYGLVRLEPTTKTLSRFFVYGKRDAELNHSYVLTIKNSVSGKIWLGLNGNGLALFNPRDSSFKVYHGEKGNPYSLSYDVVMDIHESGDSIVWVATLGGGLNKGIRYPNDSLSFIHYREAEGLPNDAVYGILEDSQKNLWLSTNKGISKFNPHTKTFKNFTVVDGLVSNEFNQGAFYKDNSGKMYFGASNGYNEFYPDSIRENSFIPPIRITSLKIFDEDFSAKLYDSVIYLNYDQNFFSIEFTSLSYFSPKSNQYAYRLEGLQPLWTNSGARRTAYYTNINPGEYIFRVKGTNNDGVWNETGTSLRIIILPPWWATLWFRAVIFFGFVGIVSGGAWYASRRKMEKKIAELEKQKAILEERQRTRDRIARDLHDDLASTVGSAGLFVETVKRTLSENFEQAKEYLEKTSSLLNEAEESMSDIVWSVSPKHDTLQSLITRIRLVTTDLCRANGIFCEVNVKGNIEIPLSDDVRRGLYLIFKEAINNCIKHAEAKNVAIQVETNENQLLLSIQDNGKGFSLESEAEKIGGNGMHNMRKRAEEIYAEITILSEKEKGTTITLKKEMTQMSH